jgi:streptogramin lyase
LALPAVSQTPTPTPAPTPVPTPGLPTTIATGVSFATENNARVNGVKLEVAEDGGVWFLEAGADSVGVLRGTTIRTWQIRVDDEIGANPVDFELDGSTVWILESGQSGIPPGTCALGRLDTETGLLTEWVIPASLPAGFYRAPDGKYWVPMSGRALLSIDPTTLQATNYRSVATYAYSDMAIGADGALWLADFGNNRIVRYVPGAATETFWTIANPAGGQINPAQIDFDEQGYLWIAEYNADRMDRFDPATGELRSYYGVNNPIHFDFHLGRVYVTSGNTTKSSVTVIDPGLATPLSQILTPQTLDVGSTPNGIAVALRTTTISPTDFETVAEPMPEAEVTVSGNSAYPGLLTTSYPTESNWGIAVSGGIVWTGTNGDIARLNLQSVGGPNDVSVPVATSVSGQPNDRVRIDLTLSNRGTAAVGGEALFMYSPGAGAVRKTFTLAPGTTQFIQDAFGNVGNSVSPANGAVRVRALTGSASDLAMTVRSTRVRPDGSSYGYALLPAPVSGSLQPGSSAILFTGSRDTEASILGLYSLEGGKGVLTLAAPDGTVRGTLPLELAKNTTAQYNPAAIAFGVDPEPGDIIRVSVESGSLQAYVNILDLGSYDIATSIPVIATADSVIPNAGQTQGGGGKNYVSELFLSNPDPDTAAEVSIAYYPINVEGPPQSATVTLAPLESRAIPDFLPTLYGVLTGQGSFLIESNVPVAAAVRIAAQYSFGNYAGFAPAIDGAAGIDGGSGIAIGLPQSSARRTNLLLYNRGVAGTITVTGFNGDGTQAGQLALELPDHGSSRLNSVFSAWGITNPGNGLIQVDVPAGMNLYAWTVEVDGYTGDGDLAGLR